MSLADQGGVTAKTLFTMRSVSSTVAFIRRPKSLLLPAARLLLRELEQQAALLKQSEAFTVSLK
jgi:hypothetical protein